MGESLRDYKVLCFNGKAQIIEYNVTGKDSHTQDFYDLGWNLMPISQEKYAPLSRKNNPKPEFLDEMIRKSEILAKDTYFLRVDWFIADDRLYSGELTLYDGAGILPFDTYEMDLQLGQMLKLPID